jgi:hypothetical protein
VVDQISEEDLTTKHLEELNLASKSKLK